MKEPTSLRGRILVYLERHPNAELTREQIAAIFGKKHAAIDKALKDLRDCGAVETVKVTRLPKGPDTAPMGGPILGSERNQRGEK